jgi:arsenate reductase
VLMLKYYSYKGWLAENTIEVEEVAIRETPPSVDELKLALQGGRTLNALFNSSGGDYRELGMKDLLPKLSELEALEMLHSRGNLVKRPFLISPKGALVGFKKAEWEQFFL